LNRLVNDQKIERRTAERLVELLPAKAEQKSVAEVGAEAIKRTVTAMSAQREWLRRAESWRRLASSRHDCPTQRQEVAGPLLAKDKEQVLVALTEARDALSGWISTIESWPAQTARAT
jgi:hypothetical protein